MRSAISTRRSVAVRPRLVTAICVFAALNATMWSLLVPPGVAPDEQAHVQLGRHVAQHAELPTFGKTEGFGVGVLEVASGDRVLRYTYSSYAAQPPTAYLLAAPWIALPTDTDWMDFHQARVPQALMLALLTLVTFLLARSCFPKRPAVAVLAAVLVATWPESSYLAAYFNADLAASLGCAAVVLVAWRGLHRGWTPGSATLLGLVMGLTLLTKLNAWVAVGVLGVAGAAGLAGPIRIRLARVGIAALTTGVVVAGWVVLNISRYGWGDPLATKVQSRLANSLDADTIDGASLGWTPWHLLVEGGWLRDFVHSFVLGIPGYRLTFVEAVPAALIAGSAFVGCAVLVTNRRRARTRVLRGAMILHLAAILLPVLLAVLLVINAWKHDVYFLDQGRYVFPALAPIAVYVARALVASAGPRVDRILPWACCAMIAWNVTVLLRSVTREYDTSVADYAGSWQLTIVVAWMACTTWLVIEFLFPRPRPEADVRNEVSA